MTRRKPEPPPRADDWRKTNPAYEVSPPRVSPCGRWVELDGGSLADYAQMLRDSESRPRARGGA